MYNQRIEGRWASNSGRTDEFSPSDCDDVPWKKTRMLAGLDCSRWCWLTEPVTLLRTPSSDNFTRRLISKPAPASRTMIHADATRSGELTRACGVHRMLARIQSTDMDTWW